MVPRKLDMQEKHLLLYCQLFIRPEVHSALLRDG